VGLVPRVFQRDAPPCIVSQFGARDAAELTALGYAYTMRNRSLQLFARGTKAWLAGSESRSAAKVVGRL